jgi:LmbE family N-acetylglucosaminyl deacetylase
MEFGCAGSLARWVDEGAEVTVAVVTDGSTGTQDRELMGEKLAAVRREESETAAKVIGIQELVWMGLRDGYVEYTLELRRDIARLFRKYRPHRFIVMDPTPTIEDRFVNHPDHRAIGLASLDVTLSAGTTPGHFPELLEEGFEPWRGLRDLYIQGPGAKPVAVDITSTIDRKIEALRCHRSQVGENIEQIAEWVRDWCAKAGAAAGYDFAETFQVIAQGPGFHSDEQEEDAGDLPQASPDPRSAPST